MQVEGHMGVGGSVGIWCCIRVAWLGQNAE